MSPGPTLEYQTARQETCFIIHPDFGRAGVTRTIEECLDEAAGLAQAINLEILHTESCKVSKFQPGYFLGKGHRERIGAQIEALKPHVVIINHSLSPVQQRNLEKDWKVKVIDRTGLILEIFGARAQTREGRLQVELAALEFQRSRLVRAWTHLERQRGGAGFMGGPGETQIELDRRIISDKITRLRREIEDVSRTREIGRRARARVPFPVVALVGYTNAGKSTLFNILTGSDILAEDMLFATLDPTLRRLSLPNGQNVILSDTVGFISDLPTSLVAAFRATLEQTTHADVIVHVIDISRADYEAQRRDVIHILEELGIEYERDERIIEIYNKADKAAEERVEDLQRRAQNAPNKVVVSALKGTGLKDLLTKIAAITARKRLEAHFEIPHTDGKALSWLYEHGEIIRRTDGRKGVCCAVMIEAADLARFEDRYGYHPQP
ncbi:MAG: GTPase HflX [Alphaproteobacteria bacterium]|nr:GTPase HflX [Alphaproteobacteria bacterium]